MHKLKIAFIAFVSFISFSAEVFSQTTTVRGAVTDAKTGDPIPFVAVLFEGTTTGKSTDFNGQYFIESNDTATQLKFTSLGYKTEFRKVQYNQSQIISVAMSPSVQELKTVNVKAEKQRYRNKNNPAVDLIRVVIDHKKANRKDQIATYEYEKYEKVQFALSNITEKFKNKKYLKHFQFIFENLDSNQMPGKVILPMYLKETLSEVYYRKTPRDQKEIAKGTRTVDFDDFVNNEGVGSFVAYLYQDVDIYQNTMPILTNQFISPISDNGPLYYRYYIKDTMEVEGTKCYHMTFYPRNKSDFNFQGELYITADTNYAVRRCELTVNPDINLNFVKQLVLTQDFSEAKPGEWIISHDNISIDFGLGKNGLGLFGQRDVSYKDFLLENSIPDSVFNGVTVVTPDSALNRPDSFWVANRHSELTRSEQGVYTMIDSIQHVPAFKRAINIMTLIFAGYENVGKFEIGPVSTFYSYNPIEGSRVRFGGRTSQKFNPNLRFESYGAYGFRDEKWKYYVGVIKAVGKNTISGFPQKNVILSYQNETKIPGQELQFVQEDNALLSIKRGKNDKLLYYKTINAEYSSEFEDHFSFDIALQHTIQSPAGTLTFNTFDYNDANGGIPSITTTTGSLTIRYAPHEQFYQGRQYRTPMLNQYPIFEVRLTGSKKGVFESDYTYQNLSGRIFKRFNIPPLGYDDFTVEGGKVFGSVPYPLLEIHRANQTYSFQLQSYNLMNFLEFISDQWVAVSFQHYFNGFFFNKIPLFKKLKWREVMSFKALYGNITDDNNPALHPDLFKFPVEQNGNLISYSLEKKPYMEASVGIANIFKVIRVDLIKRLSYLDHPNITEYGIRARAKFDF